MGITVGLFTACDDGDEPTPNASACFNYSPTEELETGTEITFTSCSENATNFAWDFGDGHMSTEENPKHTYEIGGDFTVKMIASNETSADTVSELFNILVDETSYFSFNNAKFVLTQGYFESVNPFETDITGRYHNICLAGKDVDLSKLDDENSSDYFFYVTIITDKNNVGNIIGDFSNYGWKNDAQAALDYSNIGGEYIPIGDVDGFRIDFSSINVLTITKSDNIYEIKMNGQGVKEVDGNSTNGSIELYYKGELN